MNMWTWGGGRMNREVKTVVCAMSCVKQIAGGNILYKAGSSAGCFVVT